MPMPTAEKKPRESRQDERMEEDAAEDVASHGRAVGSRRPPERHHQGHDGEEHRVIEDEDQRGRRARCGAPGPPTARAGAM